MPRSRGREWILEENLEFCRFRMIPSPTTGVSARIKSGDPSILYLPASRGAFVTLFVQQSREPIDHSAAEAFAQRAVQAYNDSANNLMSPAYLH
jgi:hypothetical protein